MKKTWVEKEHDFNFHYYAILDQIPACPDFHVCNLFYNTLGSKFCSNLLWRREKGKKITCFADTDHYKWDDYLKDTSLNWKLKGLLRPGSNSDMSLLWNGIPKDLFIEQTLTSTLLQLSNWEHFDVFSNLSIHSSYFSSCCCYEDTLALEICYLTLPNAYLSKDRKTFTDWQSRWALCTTIRTCVLSDRQIRDIRSETNLDVRPCTMQVLTCIRFRDLFYALPKAFLKERCCLFCYKRSKGKIYAYDL